MNKFFFLMILFGLGSLVSIGVLAPELELIVQQLGIFFTEDVGLLGCTCLDSVTGDIVPCEDAFNNEVTTDPLCVPKPPP